jgi:hypothetical protein
MNLNNKNTNKEGAQNITKTDQNNENKKGSLERPEGSKNGLGYPPGIINFQNPSHSGSPDKYPNQPAGAPGQSTAPGYPAYPTYPAYPSSAGYYPPPFFPILCRDHNNIRSWHDIRCVFICKSPAQEYLRAGGFNSIHHRYCIVFSDLEFLTLRLLL